MIIMDSVYLYYDTKTDIGVNGLLKNHIHYINEDEAELNNEYLSLFSGYSQKTSSILIPMLIIGFIPH